jgi:F-box and WD-40 domain protein 1/11
MNTANRPSSDKIVTGSRDQTIRIWDIRTGDCTKVIGPPPISSIGDTTTSSSQSSTSASRVITVQPSSKVSNTAVPQVYADGDIAAVRTSSSEYHRASILCLQYDKEILVTGSSDNTCIIWSIAEGYKAIKRLSQHTAGVLDVSFDANRIVSCSKDTTLCVWDRAHGGLLHQLRGHRGPVNAVEVRGNLAASGSGDSLVKLWNLDSAVCIREFDGHERGLACVQFSQDAQMIVSGGNDDVICIWNANTGECIKRLSGHKHLIRALHLDSDNRRLISASYDMSIKVYDVETGRLMLDFPGWHTSWILSAKADYRRIVSTSQDRRMLILDFGAELRDVELLEG